MHYQVLLLAGGRAGVTSDIIVIFRSAIMQKFFDVVDSSSSNTVTDSSKTDCIISGVIRLKMLPRPRLTDVIVVVP